MTAAPPRVFVIQAHGKYDLSDIRRYGEVIPLFTRDIYPDCASERMAEAVARAKDLLEGFRWDVDFICLTGCTAYMAMVGMVLTQLGIKRVTFLRFDRKEKSYYPVPVIL